MAGLLTLDLTGALARDLGAGRGVERSHLRALLPRLVDLHSDLLGAVQQGQLPYMVTRDGVLDRVRGRGRRWRKAHDRLVVMGEPGAVNAAVGWCATVGGVQAASVACVDGPDPQQLERALSGATAPHLLVLDGPPWVRLLARGLAGRFVRGTVFAGDGTGSDAWTVGRWHRVHADAAADPRFGAFGEAALTVAAWAGVALGDLESGRREGVARCVRRGMFDNPAYSLGGLMHLLARDHHVHRPALLVPASLGGWAQGVARACGGIALRADGTADGLAPFVLRHGDEAGVAALTEDPSAWLLALRVRGAAQDQALGERWTMGSLDRSLGQLHETHALQAGRPVVGLTVSSAQVDRLAAASVVCLHAAVVTAALADVDPTALPAADRLRALQRVQLQESLVGDGPSD